MAITIKDFVLQLGFDTGPVDKGLAALNSKFNKVAQTIQKSENSRNKASQTMFAGMLRKEEALGKAFKKNEEQRRAAIARFDRASEASRQKQNKASKTMFADDLRREEKLAKIQERISIRRRGLTTSIGLSRKGAVSKLGADSGSANVLKDLTRQFSVLEARAKQATSATDFSKVTNSLRLLNKEMTIAVGRSNSLSRAFTAQKFAANAARDSARNLARSYLSVFTVVAGLASAVRTGTGFESIQASMLAASGTAEQAAKDFEFVKQTALTLGRDLTASAKGFQQIAVSAVDAGLSLDQAKDLFLAGSEAATAFGLSTEDTFGVFRAFTQIISKGTVSSEELKQQLGDRLPVAMSVAARAMNTNVQGLTKMLEAGELVATDFLPKFGKELSKAARNGGALAAALQTSGVAMQRFGTTIQLGVFDAFQEGAGAGLASFFNDLSEVVQQQTPLFKTLGRVVGKTLEIMGVGIRAVTQLLRPFIMVLDSITSSFSEANESIMDAGKSVTAFGLIVSPIIRVIKGLTGVVLIAFGLLELAMDNIEGLDEGPLKSVLKLLVGIPAAFFGIKAILNPIKTLKLLMEGLGKAGTLLNPKIFTAFGTTAGVTFQTAFVAAFGVGLAALIGVAIGTSIDNALQEFAPEFRRKMSDRLGTNIDTILALGGDEAAQKRLDINTALNPVDPRQKSFFENFTNNTPTIGSPSMVRAGQAQQARVDNSTKTLTINLDAKGLDIDAVQKMLEDNIQTTFVTAMEATQ